MRTCHQGPRLGLLPEHAFAGPAAAATSSQSPKALAAVELGSWNLGRIALQPAAAAAAARPNAHLMKIACEHIDALRRGQGWRMLRHPDAS